VTNLPACQALRDRLVNGEKVTTRELRDALSDHDWEQYRQRRQIAKDARIIGADGRAKLRGYTKLLNKADMMFGLSEHISQNRNRSEARRRAAGRPLSLKPDGAQRLRDGDRYYERALERLEELIYADRSIISYLDRPWDWGEEGGMISIDKESVPRPQYPKPQPVKDSMLSVLDDVLNAQNNLAEMVQVKERSLEENIDRLSALRKLMRR
jgi:hypothetical protein